VPPSELRRVEIFLKALEFGFDFGFGVLFGIEDLHAGGGGGETDSVERGFIAGDELDQCGFAVVGKLPGVV
jgi:hypothetical protein